MWRAAQDVTLPLSCSGGLVGHPTQGRLLITFVSVSGPRTSLKWQSPMLGNPRGGAESVLHWRTCLWQRVRLRSSFSAWTHPHHCSCGPRAWMCFRIAFPDRGYRPLMSWRSFAHQSVRGHLWPWPHPLSQANCQTSCSTGLLGWRSSGACYLPD